VAVSLSSVTVKAWLRGHDLDLQDLADLLPSGDTCVVKDVDGYYLTSVEIDDRPEGVPFYEVAPRVVRRVNGLARARNPNFEPVALNGHYTEEGRVHAVVAADTVKIRARIQAAGIVKDPDGEVLPPPPPEGPARAQVAASTPDVEEALDIMGQPDALNWTQLYKVFEIVRDDVKVKSLIELGWASATEISAFTGSANRPDVSGAGARHARMGGPLPRRQMSEDVARDFISRLVTSWIDSKR
jgi:hypothetical protein